MIAAIVLFLLAAAAFILSLRSFREKGLLLNNAWLYASRKERNAMDKRPHYRQSAVVFLLVGVIFLLNGFSVLFSVYWLVYPVMGVIAVTVVYAVVSSLRLEKK